MFRRLEMRLGEIARRKRLAILLVALTPLLIRALLLPWMPAPNPRIHDEFSHLLVADTFAHGRLANPVHPLWPYFESMHTLVHPVYASPFPAAPGMSMAAAQVLTGQPWIGVWLSAGFMCGALCWMLQGWVPPGWALLGGALAAIRFGIFSYWMNSYYGGALAAAGGALVLGALPRLRKGGGWGTGVALGAGLAIVANSRPYEGLLFTLLSVAVAVVLGLRIGNCARPALLALAVTLCVTGLAMAIYFARITGSPFQLPYVFYRNTFTMAPHFVWQSPRPEPIYLHRVLHDFYTGWEMKSFLDARGNRSPHGILDKVRSYWRFYLGPILTLPLLTLPWLWARRRTQLLLLASVLFAAGMVVQVWHSPHYAAPALGLSLLLVIEALRQWRVRWGLVPVRAVVAACLITPVIGGNGRMGGGDDRARIVRQFESTGQRHLILTRYTRAHDTGDEWVYNGADIDNAPVVWAREMDPGSNRKLVQHFAGRRVWLAEPDRTPVALSPYDPSMAPDPPFRFVKLGTEAIEALRDPQEIRRKILHRVADEHSLPYSFTCDQWNYFFTAVTAVEAPQHAGGCPADGTQAVGFDQWFTWLLAQR